MTTMEILFWLWVVTEGCGQWHTDQGVKLLPQNASVPTAFMSYMHLVHMHHGTAKYEADQYKVEIHPPRLWNITWN